MRILSNRSYGEHSQGLSESDHCDSSGSLWTPSAVDAGDSISSRSAALSSEAESLINETTVVGRKRPRAKQTKVIIPCDMMREAIRRWNDGEGSYMIASGLNAKYPEVPDFEHGQINWALMCGRERTNVLPSNVDLPEDVDAAIVRAHAEGKSSDETFGIVNPRGAEQQYFIPILRVRHRYRALALEKPARPYKRTTPVVSILDGGALGFVDPPRAGRAHAAAQKPDEEQAMHVLAEYFDEIDKRFAAQNKKRAKVFAAGERETGLA